MESASAPFIYLRESSPLLSNHVRNFCRQFLEYSRFPKSYVYSCGARHCHAARSLASNYCKLHNLRVLSGNTEPKSSVPSCMAGSHYETYKPAHALNTMQQFAKTRISPTCANFPIFAKIQTNIKIRGEEFYSRLYSKSVQWKLIIYARYSTRISFKLTGNFLLASPHIARAHLY